MWTVISRDAGLYEPSFLGVACLCESSFLGVAGLCESSFLGVAVYVNHHF